jgi:hypothetical protein
MRSDMTRSDEERATTDVGQLGDEAPPEALAPKQRRRDRFLKLLVPSALAASVADVDAEALRSMGVRGVILDLDNTLAPWSGSSIDPSAAQWVASMKKAGFQLCIASNTSRPARLRRLASELGILHVPSCGKPRRKGFLASMAAMGTSPSDTVVIGDQLLTDVLGGNRLGLHTILVPRLSHKEFVGTRLSRGCERVLGKYLRRRGLWTHP